MDAWADFVWAVVVCGERAERLHFRTSGLDGYDVCAHRPDGFDDIVEFRVADSRKVILR